eukprot:TRINITY_DN2078_c0_g2_i7.p2 TRINITY_DN2078_c0_g2~~TRINITY_DN2078_c0_g2_i7.p2  ORF type:complete len:393 (+),score=106.27 TRINITY_DN2078_c0_g2_i7:584-1762(+)
MLNPFPFPFPFPLFLFAFSERFASARVVKFVFRDDLPASSSTSTTCPFLMIFRLTMMRFLIGRIRTLNQKMYEEDYSSDEEEMPSTVVVHSTAGYRELLVSAEEIQHSQGGSTSKGKSLSKTRTKRGQVEAGKPVPVDLDKIKREAHEKRMKDMEEETQRIVERTKIKREQQFNDLFDSIREEQETFVRSVDDFLERVENQDRRKKEQLHSEWSKEIYEPIQSQIKDSLDQLSQEELSSTHRANFEEYLEATSTRAGALGNTIRNENTVKRKANIKYRKKGRDPLKRDLEKTIAEKNFMGESMSTKPKIRETLSTDFWTVLECTPYHDPNDVRRGKLQVGDKGNRKNETNIVMDHFQIERGYDVVQKELHNGGKTGVRTGFSGGEHTGWEIE